MAQSTYTQCYTNFVGADMSSDARVVARNRLAYSVNMWRDYESEQGAAIETIPGFRRIRAMRTGDDDIYEINSLCHFKGKNKQYLIVQKYNTIYALDMKDLTGKMKPLYQDANPNGTTSFTTNNNLYLVSNSNGTGYPEHMIVINEDEKGVIQAKKVEEFYTPTTYYNGKPYEQRNALGGRVNQVDTGGGAESEYKYEYRPNNSASLTSETVSIISYPLYDDAVRIVSVLVNGETFTKKGTADKFGETDYIVTYRQDGDTMKPIKISILKSAVVREEGFLKVEITYNADPNHFNVIGNLTHFQNDKITMSEAILGCTKSAVYDGRVFLTGNPDLPNTVFYSQRNFTGANDPTYFGVYNYFNDGDGNTPNVDLLSTPLMLMVIKGDTTQDGSVYYHVGADNPHSEKSVRDLVPRVYPSTQGAAGLGSAGTTEAYSLSCNFLDDPVFLSRRGLEGVSKEQLNAERTIGHRSSNVDKLLVKEDLAHASIAEWKGYLVICCNGHIYLADSRAVSQHRDGSYQYEWFYLEGVGTYKKYATRFKKITTWPVVNGESLETLLRDKDITLWEDAGEIVTVPDQTPVVGNYEGVYHQKIEGYDVYTYNVYEYYKLVSSKLLDIADNCKHGQGDFYGAKRVLAVGNLLFFATDYDICVFNTDKRGVPVNKDEDDIWESDKIDSSWYTFNGVPYKSACALRLDDCDKKSLTKTTIYGTTVARLKMMPGSKCKIKSSINGRDWQDLAEVYSTRQDFSDLRFDNMSFAENEDNVAVLPEVSRGWIQKQYYFESDGFCEPFGLYELSYIYKIAGKIRYV